MRRLQPRFQGVLVSDSMKLTAPLLLTDPFTQVQQQLGWLRMCI